MPIVCSYHPRCDLPQKSVASVKVNTVEICFDAWNKATEEERGWFRRVTDMYNRGLVTKKEFSSLLQDICYHHVDPSYPVHV